MIPVLPPTIGKKGALKGPGGGVRSYKVVDEVRQSHTDHPKGKFLLLQKLQFDDDGEPEYRLGYYIIGEMPRMKGKWVWGQYATMMLQGDFRALMKKAVEKGWIPA